MGRSRKLITSRKQRYRKNPKGNVRQNADCCDGWEHLMQGGTFMCGKHHGACDHEYSSGGKYPTIRSISIPSAFTNIF